MILVIFLPPSESSKMDLLVLGQQQWLNKTNKQTKKRGEGEGEGEENKIHSTQIHILHESRVVIEVGCGLCCVGFSDEPIRGVRRSSFVI